MGKSKPLNKWGKINPHSTNMSMKTLERDEVIEIITMKFKKLLMITFYVVNPFLTCVLILCSLKTRDNQRFSGVFMVYKIRTFARNEIIKKRCKVMCSVRAIHKES